MNFHLIEDPVERVGASLREIEAFGAGKGSSYRPFLATPGAAQSELEKRAASLAPKTEEDIRNSAKLNSAILARALARDAAYQRQCWRKAKILGLQNHHRAAYERGRKELELV